MLTAARRIALGLIGASSCPPEHQALAFETGREIARSGADLICGGGSGVMKAGCEGAKSAGGLTIALLPGRDRATSPPNPWVDIAIYTGLGQARNQILVLSSAAVIAIGGEWGTLSEIAMAHKYGVPVVLLDSWSLVAPPATAAIEVPTADNARQAVEMAIAAVQKAAQST